VCHTNRLSFTRKTLSVALTALAVVGFGCGRTTETSSSTTTATTQPKPEAPAPTADFKVALVTSGPVSDNGWNAGAYKALQAVKAETGAEVENVEAKTPGDREESLRAYAQKGYPLVFGHGAEYEEAALKIEKDFPKTTFAISSGRKAGSNTTPIILNLEDGAYLLGMLAAGMSQTNKLGSVGAEKSVPVESVFNAFAAGAKAVKPNITIIPPVYTGSWDDVGKAKQATISVLDQGADIIMQDVDAAAPGVFQAVQERSKSGKTVYALGTNSDQNAVAPDVILASAPIYTEKVFVEIAKEVKAGTFKANDKGYGMNGGFIDFVLNPQLESKIPADLKTKLEETKKKITDGSFVVPKGKS
jgi:basic membrane protein A